MSDRRDQAVRDIFKGAGVVYAGLLLEVAISFLAQVLAARYLRTADFGGITVGVTLVNLGAIVGTAGLDEGLTRYLPRYGSADRPPLARLAFLVTVPLSFVLGAAIALNAEFISATLLRDPSVTTSVRVFGATIPFASVLVLAIGGIRGQEVSRYRVYVENLLRPTLRFGLVVAAVILGLGQTGFALAYAVPYAVGAAVAVLLLSRTFDRSTVAASVDRIDRERTREVLRYSVTMMVSRSANFLYRSVDVFLVLYFIGAGAVGAYGVAYAAARLVGMFSMAFNFLGAPIASRVEAGTGVEDMVTAHQPAFRWLVVLSIPAMTPLLLFPEPFITGVYRPRYAAGAAALVVLAFAFGVDNVFNAFGNLLRGMGASRTLAIDSAAGAVVNVALNLLLIPRYGILGAAVATLAAYFLMDALKTVQLWSLTGRFPLSTPTVTPAVVGAPLVGAAYLLRDLVPTSLPGLVAFGAVFATVYFTAVIVLLGFEPEEVMLARSVEERFGVPLGPLDWVLRRFS
jgi:O-antigen/teichoic acid export membrane protein